METGMCIRCQFKVAATCQHFAYDINDRNQVLLMCTAKCPNECVRNVKKLFYIENENIENVRHKVLYHGFMHSQATNNSCLARFPAYLRLSAAKAGRFGALRWLHANLHVPLRIRELDLILDQEITPKVIRCFLYMEACLVEQHVNHTRRFIAPYKLYALKKCVAAQTIQRAWKKIICNPFLQIGSRRLLREFNEMSI